MFRNEIRRQAGKNFPSGFNQGSLKKNRSYTLKESLVSIKYCQKILFVKKLYFAYFQAILSILVENLARATYGTAQGLNKVVNRLKVRKSRNDFFKYVGVSSKQMNEGMLIETSTRLVFVCFLEEIEDTKKTF